MMVGYTAIIKAITIYVSKCKRNGPLMTSGMKQHSKKIDPIPCKLSNGQLLDVAMEMADKYNLEISYDKFGKPEIGVFESPSKLNPSRMWRQTLFRLWDDEHETIINLDKMVDYNEWIDFTNNNQGMYNLDDFLSYYYSMPDIMKDDVKGIRFSPQDTCYNHCNHKGMFSSQGYGTYMEGSEVVLTSQAFTVLSKDVSFTLQRILYHEGAHAIDGRTHKVSLTSDYWNAGFLDEEKFASDYGRSYYLKGGMTRFGYIEPIPSSPYQEDFADTVSMACFEHLPDKDNAIIQSEGVEDFNTFKEKHKGKYNFILNILDGKTDIKDLNRVNDDDY